MPLSVAAGIVVGEMDGPGAKFWFKMAGGIVLAGIVLFIVLILFVKAVFAWGFLVAVLLLTVAALVFGWFVDRRNAGAL